MNLRVASVRSPRNFERGRQLETLFQNRSLNFKAFEEYDDAVEWLTSKTCSMEIDDGKKRRRSFDFTFETNKDYLLVSTFGAPKDVEEAFAYAKSVFDKVAQTGATKLLVDESMAFIHMDYHKALVTADIPEQEREFQRSIKTAVVCAMHSMELYQMLQTHANESGNFNSRVFENREQAVDWLMVNAS